MLFIRPAASTVVRPASWPVVVVGFAVIADISVITAIAVTTVTVNIVARRGAAG